MCAFSGIPSSESKTIDMKQIITLVFALFCVHTLSFANFSSADNRTEFTSNTPFPPLNQQKIQVAILLDVSNSMDGLIDQAKAQLWHMVNTLGKVRCGTKSNLGGIYSTPVIEIALYEYGRSDNPVANGYIRQLLPFTTDLDRISATLFGLSTNGGDEFCGQVMLTSLQLLQWDPNPMSYKTIFIAGNEDFLQGPVHFQKACNLAKEKGVIINTLYCGSKADGIREHWNIIDQCGGGSFTNINPNLKIDETPTPYDDQIITLNSTLNNTYIAYGSRGMEAAAMQHDLDEKNRAMSKSVAVKRARAKGNKMLYQNNAWDLVDRYEADSIGTLNLPNAELPDALKGKSKKEIKKYIEEKQLERARVREQIDALSKKREQYLADEKNKNGSAQQPTLESEIEKSIYEQIIKVNMFVE